MCTYLTLKIKNVYKLKERDLKWKTTRKKEGEQSIVVVGEVTWNGNKPPIGLNRKENKSILTMSNSNHVLVCSYLFTKYVNYVELYGGWPT